jgi:hypothetical protein
MSVTRVQLVGNVNTGASFAGVITASSFSGDGSNLTGVGIGSTGDINTTGIITATSFSGDGSGLTGVGIGSEGSINTTGIITASTISANEFIGTGDGLIFSPTITSFSPTSGATDVSLNTNIVLTFNQPIYAGVGSIFLRNSSGIGTIIEAIGIGSTSQITINNQTLTINPTGSLPINTNVYVVLPQGVVTNAVGGNNALLDTYNFTTIDFALSSIDPANGATAVGIDTNVTLTFTSPPSKGTGTIELRSGSTSGSVIESFNVSTSSSITTSGNNFIINPTNNLGFSTSIHTIIPSTAIVNYVGLNTTGADSHSFTTRARQLGDSYEGGFLICCASPLRWVVSPYSAEVSRDWHNRNDANTRAQQVSGCTGWFVPTISQLQNPGYCCRSFWGPSPCYSSTSYWSSTERDQDDTRGCRVPFTNGSAGYFFKYQTNCVRSFRCVTY